MAIWGADIAQLKALGTKLQAGSSEIEKQKSQLSKALDGTDWKGPDADKFRSEWSGSARDGPGQGGTGAAGSRQAGHQERFPAGRGFPLGGLLPSGMSIPGCPGRHTASGASGC